MVRIIVYYALIVAACNYSSPLLAQKQVSTVADIKPYLDIIRNTTTYAFTYSIKESYPNGQTDSVNGELYVNNARKVMFSDNSAVTMIYTDTWFYKADHNDKQIGIVKLSEGINKKRKEALDASAFNSLSVGVFIDSFIVKHASIVKKNTHNDTTSIEISFPAQALVRSIKLLYSEKEQLMIGCIVITEQPYNGDQFGKNKSTIRAVEYKRLIVKDDSKYAINNYFSFDNNKIVLKKNTAYKLSTKL